MKKIQTILFFLFIALFWSCSMLEHDEERGCIFVQLNSGTILSKLNSGSSRGNVSSSVQENFTARLIVTNGSSEIHSTSKAVSENDNLTFSVAGLPVKTVVTVKMQIIGSSGTVYFEGSKDVFVLEGNTPVEIVLNKKFKLCGILNDGEKINRYYDEGEAGILPLKDNEITFFFVPYETDLTNFDPENFSSVPADEWRWELNGNELDGGVNSVNPCSVSLKTSGLEYEKTNVLKCTVKIGEVSYQAVYNFTVSSEPEVDLNKKFKLCGILNDGEKINRYYDEGEAGILPLKDNEITFFFVPYETDLTNFDPENFSSVPADEWRWELNGNELDGGVNSVNPCSVSLKTSGLESEKTNVLTCTVKIGEVSYQAVYKFTVSSEPEVDLNKKFKLCGILNDGEKINRYYDEGEVGILPLKDNEITFFFVSDDTDLTNFDPENFSYVTADEWRWELNGNELDGGDSSVSPCSVSPATSVLEYEKTNVLKCTVKIGEEWYEAVYNFTVEQPVIVNLNTKFKLCGTLYNGDKLQHFYNYTDISTLPLNDNEIKFFFVPYETDLISFDPENFSYVPADEWRWELNGKKLDDGFDSVNSCSVSLETLGLEYEKTNVLTCTVKIAEVWYQAVHKFTVEQPAASANYNSYAFYVENKDYYNGYISAYNVDSRFVIPGTENNIINYKFNVTADAGKTYLYYKESDDSVNYKIMCSQNKPGMELASNNSKLEKDTFEVITEDGLTESPEVNWLTDNGASEGQGELIGKRIAYDSVTKKYWMLGKASTDYYMLSTDSITEEADLQHYNMTGLISEGQIESLDGNVDFAVYNNYIVLYVNPYDNEIYSTKFHILKINEDNALDYITYIDNASIFPLDIGLTDIQAVGSDIYLLYGTTITFYYNTEDYDHHSYGFVARLTYKGDNAAKPYEYDNSFGNVGLTANFLKETVIKMSDGYYSGSTSSTEATYFSYYGPTEEDADCSFFGPLYFAAIKDDYLYVIDDGFRKKEDSETGALANRDRLMKVSLKDKTVSVEKDGISLMAGNGSVPNIFEF